MPRRPALPCSLVDQPRRKASWTPPGGRPGPSSETWRTAYAPSTRASKHTCRSCRTVPGVPASSTTASRALSIRLPTMVTTSRVGATSRGQCAPGSISKATPRSCASAALPSSSAVSTGSSTEPTTRSVSSCETCSSSVAKPSARSVWPSSMRLTMVWRRLADSCACERSASVRPRAESSSPVRASRSVRSRSVATWPSSRPSQRAGPRLSTITRAEVTCSSSSWVTSSVSAVVSAGPSPRSATRRPTASGGSASNRVASSLASRSRPSRSVMTRPSETACSTAS